MHNKIRELSFKRIKYLIENKVDFYKGPHTYLEGIKDEIKEVEDEIKDNNCVYLEDELGDVFWDYVCLLHSLEKEGKIRNIDNVFEKCYKKYIERLGKQGAGAGDWGTIKNIQKQELKIEHKKLYKNG